MRVHLLLYKALSLTKPKKPKRTVSRCLSRQVLYFSVITLMFFLFRFSGQGVLTMSSRNMVMKWFERHRGRANAINALSVSLGFSMAPILIDSLITRYDWNGAWRLMGFFMFGIAVIAFLFFRDNPEKYG